MAILLVIAHNVQLLDTENMHGLIKAAQWVLNIGWVGVTLFFCLSGFLITHILLSDVGKPCALRRFVARRTLRIFPLYYIVLLVILLGLPTIGYLPDLYQHDVSNSVWLWTYLSNWMVPGHLDETGLSHFWSLAVEEQFYLFWPLLVLGLKTPKRILFASISLAVVSLICRIYWWDQPNGHDINYYWTICRMDGLALGAAAASCWADPGIRAWGQSNIKRILLATGLLFGIGGLLTHGYPRTSFLGQTAGYSTLAICFSSLVFALALQDQYLVRQAQSLTRWLKFQALTQIGKYSYAMYVFHKPLHDVFSPKILRAIGVNPAGNLLYASLHIATVTAASYLMARLSYILIEQHFLKLKARFA